MRPCSGKGAGKSSRGYGRQNSMGSGDGMSLYAQYQPWQDGSMMYGPDAARARDDQPFVSYRQDALQATIQQQQQQQRRAPGIPLCRAG